MKIEIRSQNPEFKGCERHWPPAPVRPGSPPASADIRVNPTKKVLKRIGPPLSGSLLGEESGHRVAGDPDGPWFGCALRGTCVRPSQFALWKRAENPSKSGRIQVNPTKSNRKMGFEKNSDKQPITVINRQKQIFDTRFTIYQCPVRVVAADGANGSVRAKAALKRTHSKRFANFEGNGQDLDATKRNK